MTVEPDHDNRRHFSRIEFDARTELVNGDQRVAVTLIDISLKGALIELPTADSLASDCPEATLDVMLLGHELEILMQCEISHREENRLGLRCIHIDVDSITHLRRLVELNLGDSSLLDRELANLA